MRKTGLAATLALAATTGAALLAVSGETVTAAESKAVRNSAKSGAAWVRPGVPHPGADQILWVPTFAQAEQMAKATGRPILAVGHVSDWNGY